MWLADLFEKVQLPTLLSAKTRDPQSEQPNAAPTRIGPSYKLAGPAQEGSTSVLREGARL